ncbi:MAG: hypothetical protein PVH41_07550 [Anaerolineae bacterium]
MRRWFAIAWIGLLLLPTLGCQPVPVSAQAPPEEEVDLHRQIQLLNLINGLELTPEQMRFVLEKAEDAQAAREALKAEADPAEFEVVLQEIRDTLMAGQNVSDELRDAFFTAQVVHKRLIETYRKEVGRLALEIEETLESHQLYALEDYVPCVIPPEGEPRIGQAGGEKGVAVLERLRAVPAERFERHKEKMARRVLERLKWRFRRQVLILDREAELERILRLMQRAWSMPDVAFELENEQLIEELIAPYEAQRSQVDVTAVIGRHLLDPAIIPLLEQKLALMEE